MVNDDADGNVLHASQNNLNDLPVYKGNPNCPYIMMNTCHGSIEILNCRFSVQQGSEGVDQVYKTGQNRCDEELLLDHAVNLCIPDRPRPLLDLLCPGYALLNITPHQFCVNIATIRLD